jgi:hypothetical protein
MRITPEDRDDKVAKENFKLIRLAASFHSFKYHAGIFKI